MTRMRRRYHHRHRHHLGCGHVRNATRQIVHPQIHVILADVFVIRVTMTMAILHRCHIVQTLRRRGTPAAASSSRGGNLNDHDPLRSQNIGRVQSARCKTRCTRRVVRRVDGIRIRNSRYVIHYFLTSDILVINCNLQFYVFFSAPTAT